MLALGRGQEHSTHAADHTSLALGCVVRLEMPFYPALGRSARQTGVADARFEVGKDGEARSILVEGVPNVFRDEVRAAIAKSKFQAGCADRILRLRFSFELVSPPIDPPGQWTSF